MNKLVASGRILIVLFLLMGTVISTHPTQAQTTVSLQQALQAASPEASDLAGSAVAITGNWAVVGVPQADTAAADGGSVLIFERSGSSWTQQASLTASDASAKDQFGYAVAASQDWIVVGAPFKNGNTGQVYVFGHSSSGWVEQAKLTATDANTGDDFGAAVAISGNIITIGAYQDDGVAPNAGAAYAFTFLNNKWVQEAKFSPPTPGRDEQFGFSVAVSGNSVLVGAPQDDTNGTNTGAAFVFTRSGNSWTPEGQLTISGAAAGDDLGWSVALAGDTALVGALFRDDGASNAGAAYVFTRSGGTWTRQAQLVSDTPGIADRLGYAVALSDTGYALVGAPYTDNGSADSGAAYLYKGSGANWSAPTKLPASPPASRDFYGWALAVSGDTFLVGSPYADVNGQTDAGTVAVVVTPANPTPTPSLTLIPTTQAPTFTPTPTLTIIPSVTAKATWTPTLTASFTATWTATITPSATWTWTPTASFTATHTASATNTATKTYTPTATWTATHTATATWTPTATATKTPTHTATATWTPTATVTKTATHTQTATITVTATATNTPSATWTPTPTATKTPTNTPSATWTPTATNTPSATSTPSATNTPSYTPSKVPTTAVPTTAVPTTAVPTTAVPTTAVPTTAVPTTAVPTTAVPTTAVPTTAVPTTAVPTTAVPTPVVGVDGDLLISPTDIALGETLQVHLTDGDLDLDPTVAEAYDIALTSNTGETENVHITETGLNTGVFEGSVNSREATGSATNNDGVFDAHVGDVITATYVDELSKNGDEITISKTSTVVSAVIRIVLVNANTGADITQVNDGDVLIYSQLPKDISARAETSPAKVGSVVFIVDGKVFKTENDSPYALYGNTAGGAYYPGPVPVVGRHVIEMVPYSERDGKGVAGRHLVITFEIVP